MISNYNLPPAEHYPIRNLILVVAKRLTIRGFIVRSTHTLHAALTLFAEC